MEEIHRVCRPGAIVQLRTPHFSSALAYSDPTHRHYISLAAVRSLADLGFAHYGAARFEVLSARVDTSGKAKGSAVSLQRHGYSALND
jgi:hypothetical protein